MVFSLKKAVEYPWSTAQAYVNERSDHVMSGETWLGADSAEIIGILQCRKTLKLRKSFVRDLPIDEIGSRTVCRFARAKSSGICCGFAREEGQRKKV